MWEPCLRYFDKIPRIKTSIEDYQIKRWFEESPEEIKTKANDLPLNIKYYYLKLFHSNYPLAYNEDDFPNPELIRELVKWNIVREATKPADRLVITDYHLVQKVSKTAGLRAVGKKEDLINCLVDSSKEMELSKMLDDLGVPSGENNYIPNQRKEFSVENAFENVGSVDSSYDSDDEVDIDLDDPNLPLSLELALYNLLSHTLSMSCYTAREIEQAVNSGFVKKMQVLATDNSTSYCLKRQKIYKIDELREKSPPWFPGCRCSLLAEF